MKRLKYIDLAKGITMLTIIWGHIMLSGKSNILVYAFHIPVFFFLSGLVFNKEKYPSLSSFLKNRFYSLLIPYFLYSLATWAFWIIDMSSKGNSLSNCWRPLIETFIARGSAGYMLHNPALWFIPCLFMVEFFYYFICKLPSFFNIFISVGAALIGSFLMQSNSFFDFTALPWNLEVALTAVFFYSLGHQLSGKINTKLMDFSKKNPILLLLATVGSFVLLFVGSVWNGHVSMAQCQLGEKSVFLFYVNALWGILFILFACLFLDWAYNRVAILKKVLDYLLFVGRNSFRFMAVHIPCMLVCVRIMALIAGLKISDVRNDYQYTIPIWVGVMILSTFLTLLIRFIKNKLTHETIQKHSY